MTILDYPQIQIDQGYIGLLHILGIANMADRGLAKARVGFGLQILVIIIILSWSLRWAHHVTHAAFTLSQHSAHTCWGLSIN